MECPNVPVWNVLCRGQEMGLLPKHFWSLIPLENMHILFKNVGSTVRLRQRVHIIKYNFFLNRTELWDFHNVFLQSLRVSQMSSLEKKGTKHRGSQTFTVTSVNWWLLNCRIAAFLISTDCFACSLLFTRHWVYEKSN